MKRLLIAVGGLLIIFISGDAITSLENSTGPGVPDGPYEMTTGQTPPPKYIREFKIESPDNSSSPGDFDSQELLDLIERAEQKGMDNSPEMEILKEELNGDSRK